MRRPPPLPKRLSEPLRRPTDLGGLQRDPAQGPQHQSPSHPLPLPLLPSQPPLPMQTPSCPRFSTTTQPTDRHWHRRAAGRFLRGPFQPPPPHCPCPRPCPRWPLSLSLFPLRPSHPPRSLPPCPLHLHCLCRCPDPLPLPVTTRPSLQLLPLRPPPPLLPAAGGASTAWTTMATGGGTTAMALRRRTRTTAALRVVTHLPPSLFLRQPCMHRLHTNNDCRSRLPPPQRRPFRPPLPVLCQWPLGGALTAMMPSATLTTMGTTTAQSTLAARLLLRLLVPVVHTPSQQRLPLCMHQAPRPPPRPLPPTSPGGPTTWILGLLGRGQGRGQQTGRGRAVAHQPSPAAAEEAAPWLWLLPSLQPLPAKRPAEAAVVPPAAM